VAAVTELTRRLDEARAAEAFAAAKKRRDDAETAVDRVVVRIRSEYAVHAEAIAELVAQAKAADAVARSINRENWENASELPPIVLGPLGWGEIYHKPPEFGDAISLPAVEEFAGIGKKWLTREGAFALYAIGNPDDFLEKA
jgi:hypothetical protein